MANLSKPNARDVAKARQALTLGTDGERMYAASLSGIHRSSSRQQQMAVEYAICDDGMQHLFKRHPVNGCMLSAFGGAN